MIRILYALIIVLAMQSCDNSPDYSMDESKMAEVICDLHLAESAAAQQEGSRKDSIIQLYYRQIYEIHSISENDFIKNMGLLKTDLEKMERVYKLVGDSLDKRKSRL